MVDCGDCWIDDTFHGCKLTAEECLTFTGMQEDSNKIVAIKNIQVGNSPLLWKKALEDIRKILESGGGLNGGLSL